VDDPIELVRRGYDAIAPAFLEWHAEPARTTVAHLERLRAELRPGARLLDLGCGPGTSTSEIREGRRIGVYLSVAQLSLRR
jgi:cyclopropane fatty-acyl-phospholipid synthase-like methyltransferase